MRLPVALAVACGLALVPTAAVAAPTATATLTISISPTDPQIGQKVTVSGDLSGATSDANQPLTATRSDKNASDQPVAPGLMTDGSGHYSFTDNPAVAGKTTYTVTLTSDTSVTASGTITVLRKTTPLSLSVSAKVVTFGHEVHLTAHVGGTEPGRTVTITAHPYQRKAKQVTSQPADANGDVKASYTMAVHTKFVAHVDGDSVYAPATTPALVQARALVHEKLRGGYGRSGRYRLYRPRADVTLFVQLLPRLTNVCVAFQAQRRYDGGWHTVSAARCPGRTDDYGQIVGIFSARNGPHVVGEPYRIRAKWHGDYAAAARKGKWRYLKFRRP